MIYPNSKMFLPIYKNNSGPQPGPDYSNPLTFKSTGNTTVAINKENLSYKKNTGDWTAYTANDEISLTDQDTVSFSGTNSYISTNFVTTGNGTLEVYGNPHSMINYSDLTTGAFYGMFSGCTKIIDVSNLILSATTLAPRCYMRMFNGCTNLSLVSQNMLPATTLDNSCYYGMFADCFSLTSAPALPATTLANSRYAEGCYREMFYNCSSLLSAPDLPATELENWCYFSMFTNCTSLSAVPQLPATYVKDRSYSGMFTNCTSLSTVPKDLLQTTKMNYWSCAQMFEGCTSLIEAPDLPATQLSDSCYFRMFWGCTNLSSIEVGFTYWNDYIESGISKKSTWYWVEGVATNGTFICPTALGTDSNITRDISHCPEGWTVINK